MMHEDKFIDLKTLSERLSLSQRTIRTWITDPATPIPAYRVGGKLLFRWGEVEQWLSGFMVKPANVEEILSEIETELKVLQKKGKRNEKETKEI